MKNLIGDKNSFAIEYVINKVHPHIFGNVLIWLGGNYIGLLDEEVMLNSSLGSLIDLISEERMSKYLNIDIHSRSKDDLFTMLQQNSDDLKDNAIFSLDESTDDFCIFVVKYSNTLRFLWALNDEPYGVYNSYPEGVLSVDIDVDVIKSVIEKFENDLKRLK